MTDRIPIYVAVDPDSGQPSALAAFSNSDVISEVVGGTGRNTLSGLITSVDNVPVTYNSGTRQFTIGTVSAEAVVDFENIRDAFASGTGTLGFGGDFVVSGGGKIRGAFSGNLEGNAETATNAIYSVESLVIRDVKFNGIEVDLSGGTDVIVSASEIAYSAVKKSLGEANSPLILANGYNFSMSGGGVFSGNLSGNATSANLAGSAVSALSATNAFKIPRVQINGTLYDLSSDGNDIVVGGAVDFTGVSSAIYTGTGPLNFNGIDLSSINIISATSVRGSTVSGVTVTATGNISTTTGTVGAANVIGTTSVKGASVSATVSLSGPLATLTTVNSNTVTAVNITGTDGRFTGSLSSLSITGITGRFTTDLSSASISGTTLAGTTGNITTVNATTVTGVNITGTDGRFTNSLSSLSVTGTTLAGTTGNITTVNATTVTGVNITGTDGRFTNSLSSLSVTGTTLAGTTGNITTINATNVTGASVTATNFTATNNVTVTGNITATGTISTTGTITGADIRGTTSVSSASVTGTNINAGTLAATGNTTLVGVTGTTGRFTTDLSSASVTGTNVVGTTSVRGASVSATTEFSGPAATITTVNATTVTGVNVTGTNIRGGTVSATTSFSGPAATITSFTATDLTATNNVSVTGTLNVTGSTTLGAVTGTTGRFTTDLSSASVTGTNVIGTTSVRGASVSATTSFSGPAATITSFTGTDVTAANIRGTTSISSLSITGTSVNAGDFTATGNTTLAAFSGTNARINGTLQVTSTIDASGDITTTTGTVKGFLVSGTSLEVPGDSKLGNVSASIVSGATLTFTGTATLGSVTATGNIATNTGQVRGATVSGTSGLFTNLSGVSLSATTISATNYLGITIGGQADASSIEGVPAPTATAADHNKVLTYLSGSNEYVLTSKIGQAVGVDLAGGQEADGSQSQLVVATSGGTYIVSGLSGTGTFLVASGNTVVPAYLPDSLLRFFGSGGGFPSKAPAPEFVKNGGEILYYDITNDRYTSTGDVKVVGANNLTATNLSGTGIVQGTTVSATNYLNLPSSTIVWASANYATLAGSSTSSLIATNATSATSALNAQQAPAGFTVTGTLSAGAVSAAIVSAAEAFYVDGATGYIVNPTGNLTLSSVGGTIATNSTMNVANGSGNIFLRAGRAAIYTDTAVSAYYIATNNYADPRMNFAIAQTSAGDSYVGAKSGQSISFVVPSNTVSSLVSANRLMQIEASGINVRTGIVSTSSILADTVSATTYLNLPSGVATWNANKLQGYDISAVAPSNDQVLKYNSTLSAWVPGTDTTGGGGGGIADASSLRGSPLSATLVPTAGQALMYNGSVWTASAALFAYTYGSSAPTGGSDGDIYLQTDVVALQVPSVSATNYYNLPSGTLTWTYATSATSALYATNATSATSALYSTNATSATSALNARQAPAGFDVTGMLTAASGDVSSTRLTDYSEKKSAPTISSSALTLDLTNSQVFTVALNSNISTLTISNPDPRTNTAQGFTLILTADGTARTISWPGSVKWPSGTGPTLTSTNNKVDILSFLSPDNGTTWYGFTGGQNF